MLSSALFSRRSSLAILAILGALIIIYSLRYSYLATWASQNYPLTSTSAKPPSAKNVAAIIEDRSLSNLAPLLLHFSSVLGPDWPVVLFTTSSFQPPKSPAFRRAVEAGRISIQTLPEDVHFSNHAAVSEFLTLPWFWEQLAPAGHVLMFQADSVLCANSESRVEDFLTYDFVGAPIDVPIQRDGGHGEGYNGGLSLRNRSMILDIVNRFSWSTEKAEGKISMAGCVTKEPCLKFEDQWFFHKMKEMPEAVLPDRETAARFAVETVWYDTPLGFHQVERWNSDKMEKVKEWCPEYTMATTDLIVKHGKSGSNEQDQAQSS